ncbi:MAG: T9SS type A sorting domain-containing protein [Bacteroidota bacterium]
MKILAISILLLCSFAVTSQTMDWTRQIITCNSGRFEYSPPYNDFVTAQSYDPATKTANQFSTIFTQSAQDILIRGNVAFVIAQDSIIKYDLNTYERLAAVADSGIAKLAIFKNRLIVSKQYPLTNYFVEVLDTSSLALIGMVDNISGDCSGIATAGDTVYVAVNGGWMGTEGKIAVIDPSSWTLVREVNLGAEAVGIFNLYQYGGKIYSVNKTPYGMPAIGSISVYNTSSGSFSNRIINVKVGNGTGIKDSILYFMMNEGIGSFSLASMQIADTTLVRDPGSAIFTFILSSAVDTLNDRFYTNIGNFMTPGYCMVSTLTGDSITSYPTGISSDVVGIDYREYPVEIPNIIDDLSVLSVYPNPAIDRIILHYTGKKYVQKVLITDVFGKIIFNEDVKLNESGLMKISIEKLPAGMYCLMLKTTGNPVVAKFIKW